MIRRSRPACASTCLADHREGRRREESLRARSGFAARRLAPGPWPARLAAAEETSAVGFHRTRLSAADGRVGARRPPTRVTRDSSKAASAGGPARRTFGPQALSCAMGEHQAGAAAFPRDRRREPRPIQPSTALNGAELNRHAILERTSGLRRSMLAKDFSSAQTMFCTARSAMPRLASGVVLPTWGVRMTFGSVRRSRLGSTG